MEIVVRSNDPDEIDLDEIKSLIEGRGYLVHDIRIVDTRQTESPVAPTITPAARGFLARAAAEAREAGVDPATQAALDNAARLGIKVPVAPAEQIAMPEVPDDFPVAVLLPGESAQRLMTCGTCGRSWDDAIPTSWTPVPSGRCPFEYFHGDD